MFAPLTLTLTLTIASGKRHAECGKRLAGSADDPSGQRIAIHTITNAQMIMPTIAR